MIKFVKGWSDVTIGQYQEIMNIQSENEISKFIESISIIMDCDPQEIRNLDIASYKEVRKNMAFISDQPSSSIDKIIEVEGRRYGLIPDMKLVKAGEFLDAELWKKDVSNNLHNYVAMLYRPVIEENGDEYKIADHKPEGFELRAELFKDKVSIENVLGAVLFFSLLEMKSLECLMDSLAQTNQYQNLMKMTQTPKPTKKRKRKASTNNGDSTI